MISFHFLSILDILGMIAFSISGAIAAVRKEMDIYGVFLLAIITAMGGGTIRDVLIGKTPVTVLIDPLAFLIPLGVAIATLFTRSVFNTQLRTLLVMDAIGIGMFTISGVSSGLQADVPFYGALMLGVITSTAGGIMRDLLGGEVPLVLRRDIYASASILGGIAYWLLAVTVRVDPDISALVCTTLVIAIRLLSIHYGWHLPYPHKRSLEQKP